MTPMQAAEAALEWSRRFGYQADADGADVWETARELERRLGADCDGHAVGCLMRMAELLADGTAQRAQGQEGADHAVPCAPCPLRLVIGDTATGRHAWCEIELDGAILWGDPTPGYADGWHGIWFWGRTPLFYYEYDGQVFGARGEYRRA